MEDRTVEYRVRPVTRYVVTKWHSIIREDGNSEGGSGVFGEFDHVHYANEACKALSKADPGSDCFLLEEPQKNLDSVTPVER